MITVGRNVNKSLAWGEEYPVGIRIGNNNDFKNVTIAERINGSKEHKVERKTFAEKHPILIGLFCSFVIGILLMFGFWQNIVSLIEDFFLG